MRVKVKVTEECIKYGTRSKPSCCPVALALRPVADKLNLGKPAVGFGILWFTGMHKTFNSPLSVNNFIRRFDLGKSVRPFTFTITLP